jgi:MFS family permease
MSNTAPQVASVSRRPFGQNYALVVVAVIFLALLSSAGLRATPGVLMLPLQKAFGWNVGVISSSAAIGLFLYGLVGPFAASVMLRFGIRRTVLGALTLMSASTGASYFMTAPWQLFLTWGLLSGIGSGVVANVLGATIVNRWFTTNRGLVMGLLTASTATGTLIFMPGLAALVEWGGWRPVVLTVAACCAALIPLVISNKRTDQYGGSLENRMRYPLEVFDAVRAVFPSEKPVGVKVSATDWVEGGWDLPQTIEFVRALKKRGVDWIDASSGGVSPLQKIPLSPGYQVPFAQGIKEATGVTTIAVGLITEAKQAEEIVASGKADMVALARAMLYDPRWGWHAAAEPGGQVEAPRQYWRSQPSTQKALFGATTFGAR